MNYRLLPADEFEKLKPFCERYGIPVPKPETSYVAVVEDGERIIYTHMAHLQLHLDNQQRGEFKGYINMPRVYRCIEERIPRPAIVYTLPTYWPGVRLAEICGFRKVEFPTMIKELPCR